MKKRFRYMAWVWGTALMALFRPMAVYGGNINGNEQELLNIISGTESYNGQTYKVKDEYIAQARAYFLQDDVDITDSQKQEAIRKMYGSIAQGVEEGYLEPVGGLSEGISENGIHRDPGTGSGPDGGEMESSFQDMPESTAPETTFAPEALALQNISVTDSQDPIHDFPLEEIMWDCPDDLIRIGGMTGLFCLALMGGYAFRSGLFHHHHQKRGKQK